MSYVTHRRHGPHPELAAGGGPPVVNSRRGWRSASPYALAASLAAAATFSSPALASSCNKLVVAQIKLTAGQACWSYRGAATSFVGKFSSGQAISAHMVGEASDYDPRSGRVATVSRPRDPNVEGPGGFFFGEAQAPGELMFVAPANGTYRFSFSPCAMWGAPGAVKICAR
jgi:hypothetical protein